MLAWRDFRQYLFPILFSHILNLLSYLSYDRRLFSQCQLCGVQFTFLLVHFSKRFEGRKSKPSCERFARPAFRQGRKATREAQATRRYRRRKANRAASLSLPTFCGQRGCANKAACAAAKPKQACLIGAHAAASSSACNRTQTDVCKC